MNSDELNLVKLHNAKDKLLREVPIGRSFERLCSAAEDRDLLLKKFLSKACGSMSDSEKAGFARGVICFYDAQILTHTPKASTQLPIPEVEIIGDKARLNVQELDMLDPNCPYIDMGEH